MGRYLGPVEKLERREGIDLELKGRRALAGRTALQRRGAQPPGQHGHARRRQPSIYTQQLRESQRLKIAYGVRERQFRRLVELARKRRDITSGEALLQLLELRLDNVVFRLGLASTRRQARQFVGHGHVLVNGRRCDIASRRLKPGDTVALREDSPVELAARDAAELIGRVVAWLEADLDGLRGRVLRDPVRADVTLEVTEQLVIERYSRR